MGRESRKQAVKADVGLSCGALYRRIRRLMKERSKKVGLFVLRWGIAVGGILWVISNMTLRDHVLVLDANNRPREAVLVKPADEDSPTYAIRDPQNRSEEH